jgi:uncharacterized MAPEG superfamily protein
MMTTDLYMLVWTGVLSLLVPSIYLIGRVQAPGGVEWALGNRAQPFEVAPWAVRAQRAHANLTENLAPFAILVLVAHVAAKANGWTALGATIFFWARVGHIAAYTAGLVPWRTALFFVGSAGEVLILIQILR